MQHSVSYRTLRCSDGKHRCNERTGTPFNNLQFPTHIVLLVVLGRLRSKLSLRDLAEMFVERGFAFTHKTVRDWEARFAPWITQHLRAKRQGKVVAPGTSTKPICAPPADGTTCTAL